jgi:hypothetical protein
MSQANGREYHRCEQCGQLRWKRQDRRPEPTITQRTGITDVCVRCTEPIEPDQRVESDGRHGWRHPACSAPSVVAVKRVELPTRGSRRPRGELTRGIPRAGESTDRPRGQVAAQVRSGRPSGRGAFQIDRASMPPRSSRTTPRVRGGGKGYDPHAEYSAEDLARWMRTPVELRAGTKAKRHEQHERNRLRNAARRRLTG